MDCPVHPSSQSDSKALLSSRDSAVYSFRQTTVRVGESRAAVFPSNMPPTESVSSFLSMYSTIRFTPEPSRAEPMSPATMAQPGLHIPVEWNGELLNSSTWLLFHSSRHWRIDSSPARISGY